MSQNPRCLYDNSFARFLCDSDMAVLGKLNARYHGDLRTTSRDAWEGEIAIMRSVVSRLDDPNGKIIFEYDIPRLGKRIDVVLLLRGIVFCIE